MTRRRYTRLGVAGVVASVALVVGGVAFGVDIANGANGANGAEVAASVAGVFYLGRVVVLCLASAFPGRTRSSGWSGGWGWFRVSRGGNMRHLLSACTSVDRLVDYLLDRAVGKLPEAVTFSDIWRGIFSDKWRTT
jgi:hypothetical protein